MRYNIKCTHAYTSYAHTWSGHGGRTTCHFRDQDGYIPSEVWRAHAFFVSFSFAKHECFRLQHWGLGNYLDFGEAACNLVRPGQTRNFLLVYNQEFYFHFLLVLYIYFACEAQHTSSLRCRKPWVSRPFSMENIPKNTYIKNQNFRKKKKSEKKSEELSDFGK